MMLAMGLLGRAHGRVAGCARLLTLPVLLATLFSLLLPARSAVAVEWELELDLRNRFTLLHGDLERRLRYDPATQAFATSAYLTPSVNDIYYSFLARAGVFVMATPWLGFGLAADSGELRPVGRLPEETTITLTRLPPQLGNPVVETIADRRLVTSNGQPIATEARETFFLRQAFVRLTAPKTHWLTADLGRQGIEIGNSLIYNDFGLGVQLSADLELRQGLPLRFSTRLLLPSRSWASGWHSPLFAARAEYVISFAESVGITGAYFHDGDDAYGQLLIPFMAEAAVATQPDMDPVLHREFFAVAMQMGMPSRADVGWMGVEGNKYLGDFHLTGAVFVEIGHVSLDNLFRYIPKGMVPLSLPQGETIELDTLGVAVDLGLRYLFSESFSLGGFFLYLSGGDNPLLTKGDDRRTYRSFLGVVPYITHTNLFFSGGMNESFSSRHATTSGVNGRGVIAPGLKLDWEIASRVRTGLTVAALVAPVASLWGGKLYGVEVDVEAGVKITDYLGLSLEYDVLAGGDFFPASAPTHKLLCGLDLSYER